MASWKWRCPKKLIDLNGGMLMIEKHAQSILAAREMRKQPTQAEKVLWEVLRNRQLSGLKFYRQRVLGYIIVDFYCASARLIIEVDGDIPESQKENDLLQTRHLESCGYRVLRFKNDSVLSDLDAVLEQIMEFAFKRIKGLNPNSSPSELTPCLWREVHTPLSSPETGEGKLPFQWNQGRGWGMRSCSFTKYNDFQ